MRAAALLLTTVLAAGCRDAARTAPAAADPHPTTTSDTHEGARPAAGGIPARSPLNQAELLTTDASIALGNLEGELSEGRRLCGGATANPDALANLVETLLAHGALYGRLAEYDEALRQAERAVALAPRASGSYRARAAVRARLHNFDAALADLAQAEKLGASGRDFEQSRAAIVQAQGHLEQARLTRQKWVNALPTFDSLFALATVDADEGRVAQAERGFIAAQQHLRDVSPFPLARLWLQEALMWMEGGRAARARELLEAAHQRVPVDVAVIDHLAAALAATRDTAAAIALLRPLADSSDDPEPWAQLADLLEQSAQPEAAEQAAALRKRAAARFSALLAAHPEAFADHAARFFLGGGGDAARARRLAEANLVERKTQGAYALAIETQLAGGSPARACALADAAVAAYSEFAHLHVLAAKAYATCGRSQQAEAEIQASLRPVL